MVKTLVAALLCLVALSPLRAQDADEITRRTLVGLTGLSVVVEDLAERVERDGLRTNQIQTDVELRLRQSGITVITDDQARSLPGSPWLYVNVGTARNDDGLYAYSIIVELRERVTLVRNPSVLIYATTWAARARVGAVGAAHIDKLRDSIRDMTDQFINAYLAANPKR